MAKDSYFIKLITGETVVVENNQSVNVYYGDDYISSFNIDSDLLINYIFKSNFKSIAIKTVNVITAVYFKHSILSFHKIT